MTDANTPSPSDDPATPAAGDGMGAHADAVGAALLIDVRRKAAFDSARTLLPGATWRDPAMVASWIGELPRGRPIVVYCVHGHEVSRSTALRLRIEGFDARFLEGGIEAWAADGRPLQAKAEQA